jgi:hypothetical protein
VERLRAPPVGSSRVCGGEWMRERAPDLWRAQNQRFVRTDGSKLGFHGSSAAEPRELRWVRDEILAG